MIPNNLRSRPHSAFGDFQTTIFIYTHSFSKSNSSQRRRQALPQAIRSSATINSRKPVGKIAAIKIPSPSDTAHTPSQQPPPPPRPHHISAAPPLVLQYIPGKEKACGTKFQSGEISTRKKKNKKMRIPYLRYPHLSYFFCSVHSLRGFNSS